MPHASMGAASGACCCAWWCRWPGQESRRQGIFLFFHAWNDYFGPLLYASENPIAWSGLYGLATFRGSHGTILQHDHDDDDSRHTSPS